MTYAQLRRHLSDIAQYGDDGAPTSMLPVPRWLLLRAGFCVEYVGGLWVLTARGRAVLDETQMPGTRPADRPVQRKASREVRDVRQQRRIA